MFDSQEMAIIKVLSGNNGLSPSGGIEDSPVGRFLRTTGGWIESRDLPINTRIIWDTDIDKPVLQVFIANEWITKTTFGSLETNKFISNKDFGGFRFRDAKGKEIHAIKKALVSNGLEGSSLAFGNYESEEGHYLSSSRKGYTMIKRDYNDLQIEVRKGIEEVEIDYFELSYIPKTKDMLCVSYSLDAVNPATDMIYNMALYQVKDGKEILLSDFNDDDENQTLWKNGYRNINYKITLVKGLNTINLPIPVPCRIGQEFKFKIWFDKKVMCLCKDKLPNMIISGNELFFDRLITAREGTKEEMSSYCSDSPMLFFNTTDGLTYFGNSMWTWHKLGTDWNIPMDIAEGQNLKMMMKIRERFDYFPVIEKKDRFSLNLLPVDLSCNVKLDEYRKTNIIATIGRQLVYIPPIMEEGEPVEQEQEHYRFELTCTDLPIEDFSNCEIWIYIGGERYTPFPENSEKGITILDSDDSEMELKEVKVNHHVLGDDVWIEMINSYSKKLSINIDHRFKYENNELEIKLICLPLSDEIRLIEKNEINDSLISKTIARVDTSITKYKDLSKDFLTMFDRSGLYRCFGMMEHIPEGYNIGDNDFYVNVYDTSTNYKVLEALDIRSGRRHTLAMEGGIWKPWFENNLPLVPKVIYSKIYTNKGVAQVIPLTALGITEKDTLIVNCGTRGIAVRVNTKDMLNSYASSYNISDVTGEFTYYLDDEGFSKTLIEISKYTPLVPTNPMPWIPKLTLLGVGDISVGIPKFEPVDLMMTIMSWELIRIPFVVIRLSGGEVRTPLLFDGKEKYYFEWPLEEGKIISGEEVSYWLVWDDQIGGQYTGEERIVKTVM